MEDCCAVCAEPLQWVAYGKCGHKEACSKCVTRLRFVLEDKRCVICQQPLPVVFATKFLGAYTKALAGQEFEGLQDAHDLAKGTPYHQLQSVGAFFDEKSHFEEIRKLCSYTHPVLTDKASSDTQRAPFRSLGALKKALQLQLHLQFCDICLEHRKVFLPEQILYTKADLNRHQHSGDREGVLAESGFQGHPLCRFCNKRFFGESELFFHMQQAHEQCHICKRANPDKFEYFAAYNELEEHFRHEHFLCGHPSCLEKKFVVFASEQELKQHTAREHAGSMSRAERRQAMTIPIHIQYSRRPVEEVRGARGRQGGRLREPEPGQMATALQASLDTARRERESAAAAEAHQNGDGARVPGEADFPSMGTSTAAPFSAPGYAASAAGRNAPRPEDFPALPGTSKSAKRRAKEREKEQSRTLAERVGRPGEVRVLNSGRGPADASRRDADADAFPALGVGVARSSSASQLANSRTASPTPRQWQPQPRQPPQAVPADTRNPEADFPSLPRAERAAAAASMQPPPARSRMPPTTDEIRGAAARAAREDEFPALGGVGRMPTAAIPGVQSSAAASVVSQGQPGKGISEGLKAANKALIEKIKRQLDPGKFAEFREEAGNFLRGSIDARAYHAQVAALGLAALVPEMASLLPDPVKRAELLSIHELAPAGTGRWTPPEATAAAVKAAKVQPSWQCPACTLINEPRAGTCEACKTKRPMNDLASLSRATSNGRASSNAVEGASAPPVSKQQKKVPKFERLRLTSGGRDAAAQAEVERRTKPGNAWTHKHNLAASQEALPEQKAWGSKASSKPA